MKAEGGWHYPRLFFTFFDMVTKMAMSSSTFLQKPIEIVRLDTTIIIQTAQARGKTRQPPVHRDRSLRQIPHRFSHVMPLYNSQQQTFPISGPCFPTTCTSGRFFGKEQYSRMTAEAYFFVRSLNSFFFLSYSEIPIHISPFQLSPFTPQPFQSLGDAVITGDI